MKKEDSNFLFAILIGSPILVMLCVIILYLFFLGGYRGQNESIPIDYDEMVHETDAAWLLDTAIGRIWFPKSLCSLEADDEKYVLVPEWLAKEKELI